MYLKEIRKLKCITQEEASKLTSIPLRTYKRYEANPEYSSTLKYKEMCRVLKDTPIKKKSTKDISKKRILIVGAGYVGLSLAFILGKKHDVTVFDINKVKIDELKKGNSPIKEINLNDEDLNVAFSSSYEVYLNKDIIIIATSTDFDSKLNSFNTSSVESSIYYADKFSQDSLVVIKSTVPIGFTEKMSKKFPYLLLCFCPEFLREGKAIEDNLKPSRIIIGKSREDKKNEEFAWILQDCAVTKTDILYMSSSEAEATKLFSNAYLAMRVAFFNELDTYAYKNNLDVKNIIVGMGKDKRIGDYYNNPSFGYGGYCLPKDSKELSSSFSDIENSNLITNIVISNNTRKEYIVDACIEKLKTNGKSLRRAVVGIYYVSMKKESDDIRSSAILDIIKILEKKRIHYTVYDPKYEGKFKESDFNKFVGKSDIILANRYKNELEPYSDKVFCRDIFSRD